MTSKEKGDLHLALYEKLLTTLVEDIGAARPEDRIDALHAAVTAALETSAGLAALYDMEKASFVDGATKLLPRMYDVTAQTMRDDDGERQRRRVH